MYQGRQSFKLLSPYGYVALESSMKARASSLWSQWYPAQEVLLEY